VSRLQARKALRGAGLLSTVEAAVAGASVEVQDYWADASHFHRDHPALLEMTGDLGLMSERTWTRSSWRPRRSPDVRVPLQIPPGLVGDDTIHAAKGRWAAASGIRWREGRPEVEGGFESLTATLLTGVCRGALAWTDNAAILNFAAGTTQKVQLWQAGAVYDITPFGPPTGSAPTRSASPTPRPR
jgi:hypothetical protein